LQRLCQVGHAREISPVEILQHDEERPLLAFAEEPLAERPAEPGAHELRIVARGAQLRGRALCGRNAGQLAEKVRDARSCLARAHLIDPRTEPFSLLGGVAALMYSERLLNELSRHEKGGSGADRIRVGDQEPGLAALLNPLNELVPEA